MSNITSEELWAAWRSLQDQIDKLRNALHEIEQVASTILASLPPEISEAGHEHHWIDVSTTEQGPGTHFICEEIECDATRVEERAATGHGQCGAEDGGISWVQICGLPKGHDGPHQWEKEYRDKTYGTAAARVAERQLTEGESDGS